MNEIGGRKKYCWIEEHFTQCPSLHCRTALDFFQLILQRTRQFDILTPLSIFSIFFFPFKSCSNISLWATPCRFLPPTILLSLSLSLCISHCFSNVGGILLKRQRKNSHSEPFFVLYLPFSHLLYFCFENPKSQLQKIWFLVRSGKFRVLRVENFDKGHFGLENCWNSNFRV